MNSQDTHVQAVLADPHWVRIAARDKSMTMTRIDERDWEMVAGDLDRQG